MLIIVAIIIYIILSIIFLIINRIKIQEDEYALEWLSSNCNYYTMIVVNILQIPFNFKFYRIIYSRLFASSNLSLNYKNASNVFIHTTIFTLVFGGVGEIVAIVSFWNLIYHKLIKDQVFYTCIEALIITFLAMLFGLLDIYKPKDYFDNL